jgi:tRNA (cmo5U34)-methyltransferase
MARGGEWFEGEDVAEGYDGKWVKMRALNEGLHFCLRMVLSSLAADARVLVVGAGTGAELLALAAANPGWRFTVVEPARGMMKVCRRRAEEAGILSRCTFHEGYLETLPEGELHAAATSVLVSHFIMERADRVGFYREMARRVTQGGVLVNVDLTGALGTEEFTRLLEVWGAMYRNSGLSFDVKSFEGRVGVLPVEEVEGMMVEAGWELPVMFYQGLVIRGWFGGRG